MADNVHTNLMNNVDPIIQFLSGQDWMHVVQEHIELLFSFPEWNDYGHFVPGYAIVWAVFASFFDTLKKF